jgi:DNA-binding PadR family transcriptional regulator
MRPYSSEAAPDQADSRRPATITYALLGLLSLRSWTGYELTEQMRKTMRLVWPSSPAHAYREQQRLVRLGWATVTNEHVGRRPRSRYDITQAGRAALREWLAFEPEPPTMAAEVLVRTWFADQGEVADLIASLQSTLSWVEQVLASVADIARPYLHGDGAFPERAHLNALVGEIFADTVAALGEACAQALLEVADWGHTGEPLNNGATQARLLRLVDAGR